MRSAPPSSPPLLLSLTVLVLQYERQQKSKEPERWIMHRRAAPAPSSGSSTPVPSSSTGANTNDGVSASALRSRMMANSSLGTGTSREGNAGPSKIRAVMKAGEQVGGKSKKGRFGHGQEGDDDEFDYEEDFQDDEEGIAKIDDLADEEETKELEVRLYPLFPSPPRLTRFSSAGTHPSRDARRGTPRRSP